MLFLQEEGASEGWRKLVEGDKFHYQSIFADEKAEHLLKKASVRTTIQAA